MEDRLTLELSKHLQTMVTGRQPSTESVASPFHHRRLKTARSGRGLNADTVKRWECIVQGNVERTPTTSSSSELISQARQQWKRVRKKKKRK